MRRFLTVTAATKRSPVLTGGKRGVAATKIASLQCMPLDPVEAELRQRLALNTPHELLQTCVGAGLDIREGDVLVVAGTDYPIRDVGEWAWRGGLFMRLILEDLKR